MITTESDIAKIKFLKRIFSNTSLIGDTTQGFEELKNNNSLSSWYIQIRARGISEYSIGNYLGDKPAGSYQLGSIVISPENRALFRAVELDDLVSRQILWNDQASLGKDMPIRPFTLLVGGTGNKIIITGARISGSSPIHFRGGAQDELIKDLIIDGQRVSEGYRFQEGRNYLEIFSGEFNLSRGYVFSEQALRKIAGVN